MLKATFTALSVFSVLSLSAGVQAQADPATDCPECAAKMHEKANATLTPEEKALILKLAERIKKEEEAQKKKEEPKPVQIAKGVSALPGGGLAISFSGSSVYDSGVRVKANTKGFIAGIEGGALEVGGAPIDTKGKTVRNLSGESFLNKGSTVNLSLISGGDSKSLQSDLTGVVTLSPELLQENFGGTIPPILGVMFDLGYTESGQIYGASVYVCTTRDESGNCHGVKFNL